MTYLERRVNKYKNIQSKYNGYNYASKLEASQAYELDLRLKAGDIKGWERQFKILLPVYNAHGEIVYTVSHKVDFRAEENDDNFTLIETKGIVTTDYVFRRNLLEKVWLPEHLDHKYLVIKEKSRSWR